MLTDSELCAKIYTWLGGSGEVPDYIRNDVANRELVADVMRLNGWKAGAYKDGRNYYGYCRKDGLFRKSELVEVPDILRNRAVVKAVVKMIEQEEA